MFRRCASRCTASLAAGAAVALSTALASGREAAVIVAPGPRAAVDAKAHLRRALEQRRELDLLGDDEVTARIGAVARPVPPPQVGIAEQLARESEELLRAVAFGDDGESIESGRRILSREGARIAATGRIDAAATALGDICFIVVRALLHQEDQSGARDQLRECLRLVPDAVPTEERHPPPVRALFSAVRAESVGHLAVSITPGAHDTCTLRVHGRDLGRLPEIVDLLPGTYGAEADCPGEGRVHAVTLTAGQTTRLRLAPDVERALALHAPLNAGARLGEAAVATLYEWLLVDDLWTAEDVGTGLRITRTWKQGSETVRNSLTVSPDPSASQIEHAVARLLCAPGPCDEARYAPSGVAVAAGVTGVAALAASWVLYGQYAHYDSAVHGVAITDENRDEYARNAGRRDDFQTAAWVTAAVGGASVVASAPFLLPAKEGVPWWAWASGVTGAALSIAGTVVWLGNGKLEPLPCDAGAMCGSQERSTVPLGPMLVIHGASLLSVPITYLARGFAATDAGTLEVQGAPGGAILRFTQRSAAF